MHTKNIMSLTKIIQKAFSSLALSAIFLSLSLSFVSPVETLAQLRLPTRDQLCNGNSCPAIGSAEPTKLTEPGGLAKFIIGIAQFLTFLAVAVAVLFMVWGGFRYITSNGAEDAGQGKEILTNAAIGLVIAIVAYTIVFLISNVVNGNFFGQFVS